MARALFLRVRPRIGSGTDGLEMRCENSNLFLDGPSSWEGTVSLTGACLRKTGGRGVSPLKIHEGDEVSLLSRRERTHGLAAPYNG